MAQVSSQGGSEDMQSSGGNYWRDYTGIDVKSGPIQNLPGSDGFISVCGRQPGNTTISLHATPNPPWNMVGYPAKDDSTYTVGDLKAATGADIVEGFDPSAPPYRTAVLPDTYVMKRGEGYWVHVPVSSAWTVSW